MTQYAQFSYASPVKFYPIDGTNNSHLDLNWQKNRLLSFQRQVVYKQRWQVGDTTKLQIESTIVPDALSIRDCNQDELGTISWTEVLSGTAKIYELTLNLDSYNNKTIYLYQNVELMDTQFEFMSEAIHVKTLWPETRVITYTNSKNDFGMIWTTGIVCKFRVECAIMDYEPQNESADFVDEIHDTKLLSATVYDTFTLYFGKAEGIADWALKLLNFIIHCDNWKIEGVQLAKLSGEKWDIQREKNYPLYGASIGITHALNLYNTQLNALSVEPGIVTGFTLDTNFFGTSTNDIELEQITTI